VTTAVLVAAVLVAAVLVAALPAARAGTAPPGLGRLDHLVVLMQENRSYDSYFSKSTASRAAQPATNPDPTDPSGPPIAAFHETKLCVSADLAHGWSEVHREIDGGKMDGFTAANADPTDPTGSRAMGTYDARELGYYRALARAYGIGDRYFASVPGPTYPNRLYLDAGTSFGHVDNALPPAGGWTQKTVFEELDGAHVSWKIYAAQVAVETVFFAYVRAHAAGHVATLADYYADAAAGSLPQVAFVEPTFVGTVASETDEHPPANPQLGQQLTAKVISALQQGPDWSSSAFFLTWDEHGGYYDHVAPPAAPVPDDVAPILGPSDTAATFDHYGVRVPLIVVSPWSRPHFVSHLVHDHTSILRTIELRFGLPSLTRRDAAARPLTEFFDFSTARSAKLGKLPPATVDPAGVAQCAALHGSAVLGL